MMGILDAPSARPVHLHALPQAANFVAKIKAGVEDVNLVLVGDSTGVGFTLWFGQFTTALATAFPTHTVKYADWIHANGAYGVQTTIANGTGPRTINVWNGSVAGTQMSYPTGSKMLPMVWSKQPDMTFVNYGYNEETNPGGAVDYTTHARDRMLVLLGTILLGAACSLIVIGQAPRPEADPNDGQPYRARYHREAAELLGAGYVDMWQRFVDTPDYVANLIGADGVHPTAAGYVVIAQTVTAAILGLMPKYAPPASRAVSPFSHAEANLLHDGDFAAFAGAAPSGWTLSGATATKDAVNFETGAWAVSLAPTDVAGTTNAIMSQTVDVRRFRGRWLTLSWRVRVSSSMTAAQLADVGRASMTDDSGVAKTAFAWGAGSDAYNWSCLSIKIGQFASTLTVNLIGRGGSTGATAASFDRAILSTGVLPADMATSRFRPVIKGTDQPLDANSTVLQDVTGMTLPLAAGETWIGRMIVDVASTSVTPDIKLQVNAPVGATGADDVQSLTTTATGLIGSAQMATLAFGSSGTGAAFAGSSFNIIDFVVTNGPTPGVLQLQAAQNTSDANVVTIKGTTRLTAERV